MSGHDDPTGPPPGTAWRRSAKTVVIDAADNVLLLHMCDPVETAIGQWWELPGGGVEPGESAEEAAARELAEETGLVVDPAHVGPGDWTRRGSFRWLGRRRWQEESVHVIRLDAPADPAGVLAVRLTEDEVGSVLGSRWWSLAELAGLRTYPGRLAELAPRLLAGERVAEGLEIWS